MPSCPVCKQLVEHFKDIEGFKSEVQCNYCGEFVIEKSLQAILDSNQYNQLRIGSWIREQNSSGITPELNAIDFANLISLKDKKINEFISLIDNSEFSLDDIFDIYTQIITPNRYRNDFFTPMDLCNAMAKFIICENPKKTISIYDPTCGVGNLLYAKFKEMITTNPNLDIEVFGNDRDSCYSSFANAMFHLFHYKAYFENKNILTSQDLDSYVYDAKEKNMEWSK